MANHRYKIEGGRKEGREKESNIISVGALLLTFGLFTSAGLGIYQVWERG